MNTATYVFDIITPMFLGGADPSTSAELRAPSIRGQLRWWFRVLGGFKHLAPRPVREQEAAIFGSVAGGEGSASPLIVRVSGLNQSTDVRDDVAMKATIYDPRGYFLFPLRTKKRGVFNGDVGACPSFTLAVLWRGDRALFSSIQSLIHVFGHLGALGFRSRRTMGAVAVRSGTIGLQDALSAFNDAKSIQIRSLPEVRDASAAIDELARWLKGWRAHGRTGKNEPEKKMKGYEWAKLDHDLAVGKHAGPAFRPALGLPILTKYGNWGTEKSVRLNAPPEGRFASPVLLRPHRLTTGRISPLVVFIDNRSWPQGAHAFLGQKETPVALDLYEEMKRDDRLKPFPD